MTPLEKALKEVDAKEYEGSYYNESGRPIDGLIEIPEAKRILRELVEGMEKEYTERIKRICAP